MSDHISGPSQFASTMWSIVTGAQGDEKEQRNTCLAALCKNYWKPIYYYIRRRGLSHDDARDLTQEYFATFLEKDFVAKADRERGKFRTFVLVTVNRFLSKQLEKRKRTDSKFSLSIQFGEDEHEFEIPELATGETAESDFNKRWAMSLITNTMNRMKEESREGTKELYYRVFTIYLESHANEEKLSYKTMADLLGIAETDVTNYLFRGRQLFQKLLRDEIRQSVESESAIDEEIEALKEYLRG